MRKLTQLIERLIGRARSEGYLHPHHRDPTRDSRKPGERITYLSPEDRLTLEKLTVDDLNHRVDAIIYMEGTPGRKGRLGKYLEEERIKYNREQLEKKHKRKL